MRNLSPHDHLHLLVCLPVCLSVCRCVCLSVGVSVCLSVCLFVYLSLHLGLSFCPPVCLSKPACLSHFLCSSISALPRCGANKCCCCCLIPSFLCPLFTFQEKTRGEQKTHRTICEREAEGLLIFNVYFIACRKG